MHILNILITYMVITIFGIPNPTSVYKFPSHMYAYQIFVRKSFCVCDCAKLLSHIFLFVCLLIYSYSVMYIFGYLMFILYIRYCFSETQVIYNKMQLDQFNMVTLVLNIVLRRESLDITACRCDTCVHK